MEAKNGLTVSTSLNKSQVQNIDDLKAKFNKEKSKKEYSSGNEQNPDNTTKNANPGKSESSNVLVKIGFGPQIDSPYDNDLSLGVGFGSDLKFLIANCFGIGLNVGYQHLFMADDWADQWKAKWGNKYQNADYRTTQIRGTLTYYFVNSTLNPYLGIEMGVNKIHGHYEYEEYDTGEDYNYWVDDDYTDNHFAYAINGGLEIGLGKTVALDLNLKYNGGDESYVSGKFGLVFNICGN
jgi:opacity protein-like surface antigen